MQNGWRYYNHALIPTTAPHEPVDKSKMNLRVSGVLFARWTEEFDCNKKTLWWYVIKDTPFDIKDLKAKRRYEINKGLKNFDVKVINASEFAEELFEITFLAYAQYPAKYRPIIDREKLKKDISGWDKHIVFGAFYKETNQLCGYAWINEFDSYVDFACMKVNPEYERLGINAAIVYSIIDMYNKRLCKAFYICDGARATIHETNFQNYLEKYFGFRKAYCKLKIRYRFPIGIIVKILYLFRNIIPKDNRLTVKISNVLLYEEIARESR